MKPYTLRELHKRSIRIIDLMLKVENRKQDVICKIGIEDMKSDIESYLLTSRKEYCKQLDKYDAIIMRLKHWYLDVNKRIQISLTH
jgi:hypothetical protein